MTGETESIAYLNQRLSLLGQKKGPEEDTPKSTIEFCDERVHASLLKIRNLLVETYKDREDDINEKLFPDLTEVTPYKSELTQEGSEVIRVAEGARSLVQNPLLKAIGTANPELGAWYYTQHFIPGLRQAERRDKTYAHRLERFKTIAEVGSFQPTDPIMQIIAVSFVSQIAKDFAVEMTNALLKRATDLTQYRSGDALDRYLSSLAQTAEEIKRHEAFITLGQKTLDKLRAQSHISPDQEQLILDIAYAHSDGAVDSPNLWTLLSPIIQDIQEAQELDEDTAAQAKWQEATSKRDFLLTYVGGILHEWRRHQFEKDNNTYSYPSIDALVQALRFNPKAFETILLAAPSEYREFFETTIADRVKRAEKQRRGEIMTASLPLSNSLCKIISKDTEYVVVNKGKQIVARARTGVKAWMSFGQSLKFYLNSLGTLPRPEPFGDRPSLFEFQQVLVAEYLRHTNGTQNPSYTLSEYLNVLFFSDDVHAEDANTSRKIKQFVSGCEQLLQYHQRP